MPAPQSQTPDPIGAPIWEGSAVLAEFVSRATDTRRREELGHQLMALLDASDTEEHRRDVRMALTSVGDSSVLSYLSGWMEVAGFQSVAWGRVAREIVEEGHGHRSIRVRSADALRGFAAEIEWRAEVGLTAQWIATTLALETDIGVRQGLLDVAELYLTGRPGGVSDVVTPLDQADAGVGALLRQMVSVMESDQSGMARTSAARLLEALSVSEGGAIAAHPDWKSIWLGIPASIARSAQSCSREAWGVPASLVRLAAALARGAVPLPSLRDEGTGALYQVADLILGDPELPLPALPDPDAVGPSDAEAMATACGALASVPEARHRYTETMVALSTTDLVGVSVMAFGALVDWAPHGDEAYRRRITDHVLQSRTVLEERHPYMLARVARTFRWAYDEPAFREMVVSGAHQWLRVAVAAAPHLSHVDVRSVVCFWLDAPPPTTSLRGLVASRARQASMAPGVPLPHPSTVEDPGVTRLELVEAVAGRPDAPSVLDERTLGLLCADADTGIRLLGVMLLAGAVLG